MNPSLDAPTRPQGRETLQVTVLLFAAYREAIGQKAVTLGVPAGSTVAAVFDAVGAGNPRFEALRPYTTFALNREVVPADAVVRDGDELAFLQPVSGGSPPVSLEP